MKAVLAGSRNGNRGFIATVVAPGTLLLGASAVLLELRDTLNTMWDVPPAGLTGLPNILRILRAWLFSFAVVGSMALVLVVLMMVSASIRAFSMLSGHVAEHGGVGNAPMSVISFVAFVILFGATYRT